MALLDDKAIGKRLSSKRLELFPGVLSRKYAMDAGIDASQYSKIEKGELPITDISAASLFTVFSVRFVPPDSFQ